MTLPKAKAKKLLTIKHAVELVLRMNPKLRTKDQRVGVWVEVMRVLDNVNVSMVTVDRTIRHIQNVEGRFKPDQDDGRFEEEKFHRKHWGVMNDT